MIHTHASYDELCTIAEARALRVELHGARGRKPASVLDITRLKVLSNDGTRVLTSHATNLHGLNQAARFAVKEITK